MSGHIVPKRFGLKYSPKPAIALEYQKPDAGTQQVYETRSKIQNPDNNDAVPACYSFRVYCCMHIGTTIYNT